jgi:hypothetical protein
VTLETRNLLLESLVLTDQFLDGRGQILYHGARSRARPSAPGRGLANPSFRHLGDVSRLLRNTLSVNTGDWSERAFCARVLPHSDRSPNLTAQMLRAHVAAVQIALWRSLRCAPEGFLWPLPVRFVGALNARAQSRQSHR